MSNARGRDLARRFDWGLRLLEQTFRLLPRGARADFLWVWTDGLPRLLGVGTRFALARTLALGCGSNVYFGRRVDILGWSELRLGSNVSIHAACYIDAQGGIQIGNEVSIAHHVTIIACNHSWDDASRPMRDNPMKPAPVVIEDDVWIGAGCRIMPGIRIGTRSVVAAGAVVTRDVPAFTVVGGVPARIIRQTQ